MPAYLAADEAELHTKTSDAGSLMTLTGLGYAPGNWGILQEKLLDTKAS